MIRIQRLKEPKTTSGKSLEPGKSVKLAGITIQNTSKDVVYVDTYERKPWKRVTKKEKANAEGL